MPVNDCHDTSWELLRQGDRQALLLLFDAHYLGLLNYGMKLTGDRELSRDAINDLLLQLWDKRNALPPVSNTRSYLLTALHRNLVAQLNNTRKKQKQYKSLQHEQELSPEEYIVNAQTNLENRCKLSKAMKQLSPREKELIALRFFEDPDYDTIASRCHISKRTAYNIIHQALQSIKENWATVNQQQPVIHIALLLLIAAITIAG